MLTFTAQSRNSTRMLSAAGAKMHQEGAYLLQRRVCYAKRKSLCSSCNAVISQAHIKTEETAGKFTSFHSELWKAAGVNIYPRCKLVSRVYTITEGVSKLSKQNPPFVLESDILGGKKEFN